jgi:hypothetical protein
MIGTLKRGIYMTVGVAFLCLGSFMRTINGSPIQAWRRVVLIAVGLFFL